MKRRREVEGVKEDLEEEGTEKEGEQINEILESNRIQQYYQEESV